MGLLLMAVTSCLYTAANTHFTLHVSDPQWREDGGIEGVKEMDGHVWENKHANTNVKNRGKGGSEAVPPICVVCNCNCGQIPPIPSYYGTFPLSCLPPWVHVALPG